jgi:hypothetical protein
VGKSLSYGGLSKHNVQKTVKADRNLLQRLLNVVTAGRTVEMKNILKHELSPIPLSLANTAGEMNSTNKAELISILLNKIETVSELPESDLKTLFLIDGHALIQAMGKPPGCLTFGDYADAFIRSVTRHFGDNTTQVDVVFDRYLGGDSIKSGTRAKRLNKKRPIRKLIDGPDVPLPQVWSQFIAMDENKADLAHFLSDMIIQKTKDLPNDYEMITGGGFTDHTGAKSTRRSKDDLKLNGNHEEADTRLILHASEAVNMGYQRIIVMCRDTDVMLLLLHFIAHKAIEVWMISGTAKKQKYIPIHQVAKTVPDAVKNNLLSFHALTGCDTTSSFSRHGKKTCWKSFVKNPGLVEGIGRNGELALVEQFVCNLYGSPGLQTVDSARLNMFSKANTDLELLPPTRDALELHVQRANYQAKIWLQAEMETIVVTLPPDAWKKESDCLKPQWTRLPPVPLYCLELLTCSCKKKCKTAKCTCFKNYLKCTNACGCNSIDCCNPSN